MRTMLSVLWLKGRGCSVASRLLVLNREEHHPSPRDRSMRPTDKGIDDALTTTALDRLETFLEDPRRLDRDVVDANTTNTPWNAQSIWEARSRLRSCDLRLPKAWLTVDPLFSRW